MINFKCALTENKTLLRLTIASNQNQDKLKVPEELFQASVSRCKKTKHFKKLKWFEKPRKKQTNKSIHTRYA